MAPSRPRPNASRLRRDDRGQMIRPKGGIRADEAGQMMMLSAVVLLVGFLALTGMVARVNQLGTQTGTEARQAVIDEAGPLKRSVDTGLARLANRTATNCCTWPIGGPITASSAMFSSADVGLSVKGTNIPAGAKITSVTSSTVAIVTPVPTAAGTGVTLNIWRPGFALKATTTPTAEAAAGSMLEQLQLVEAGHALWMDWQLMCSSSAATTATAVISLADGTIWMQVQSTVAIPVVSCAGSAACPGVAAPATVVACG